MVSWSVVLLIYLFHEQILLVNIASHTSLFYFIFFTTVDYVNGRCVMDCDEATPGCGGIATTAAFTLYADAATCCSEKLGYLNADVCASNSNPASTGTGKYFANVQDSICVNDETGTCPTGKTCAAATGSEVLYDTIEECCAGSLGWVTADSCVSRSDGTEYSTQWFVDYSNEICGRFLGCVVCIR